MRMLLFMHPMIWSILVLMMPLTIWLLMRLSIYYTNPPFSFRDFSSISLRFSRVKQLGTTSCLLTIVDIYRWVLALSIFGWHVEKEATFEEHLISFAVDCRIEELTKRPNPSIIKFNLYSNNTKTHTRPQFSSTIWI